MRMATDVKIGLLFLQDIFHLGHVMARIATDVGHVNVYILHVEEEVCWVLHPNDMVIDVAMHGAQRLERSQSLCGLDAADVARMP